MPKSDGTLLARSMNLSARRISSAREFGSAQRAADSRHRAASLRRSSLRSSIAHAPMPPTGIYPSGKLGQSEKRPIRLSSWAGFAVAALPSLVLPPGAAKPGPSVAELSGVSRLEGYAKSPYTLVQGADTLLPYSARPSPRFSLARCQTETEKNRSAKLGHSQIQIRTETSELDTIGGVTLLRPSPRVARGFIFWAGGCPGTSRLFYRTGESAGRLRGLVTPRSVGVGN
jgi:hypothetical protein